MFDAGYATLVQIQLCAADKRLVCHGGSSAHEVLLTGESEKLQRSIPLIGRRNPESREPGNGGSHGATPTGFQGRQRTTRQRHVIALHGRHGARLKTGGSAAVVTYFTSRTSSMSTWVYSFSMGSLASFFSRIPGVMSTSWVSLDTEDSSRIV